MGGLEWCDVCGVCVCLWCVLFHMEWCDVMCFGLVSRGVVGWGEVGCDVVWCDVCGVVCAIQYGVMQCGEVWHDLV